MGANPEIDSLDRVWQSVCTLAAVEGAAPLNAHEGCWCCKIDERWAIAVNGHDRDESIPKGSSIFPLGVAKVLPFHMYVEFNGWPAGMLHPYGGSIAAGELANLSTLAAALEAKCQFPGGAR